MHTRTTSRETALRKSVALLITALTALMLAAGAVAFGNATVARAAEPVQLTYTVWFSPTMTGVFGGDFTGTFGGKVLSRTPIPGTPIAHLEVLYVLTADDPALSFTAIVQGDHNAVANSTVLNGEVTAGAFTGDRAHSEFQNISSCPGKPSGPCFQGTLRLM